MAYKSNTRRQFLKGMANLGVAGSFITTGIPLSRAAWEMGQKTFGTGRKLAVIGGGMGGVSSAWLCESGWDVELFESRSKVGGHCDSVTVEYEGMHLDIDVGAQFFSEKTHPLYVSLLEELGLHSRSAPHHGKTIEIPGSLSISVLDEGYELFNSKSPYWNLITAMDLAKFSRMAREFILSNSSYFVTLEDWIDGLPFSHYFKSRILWPWMSSINGGTIADARKMSARSVLGVFALALPENPGDSGTTTISRMGMGGILQHLLTQCENTRLWSNADITGLCKKADKWFLQTESAEYGPYDQIIINAPPRVSRNWFDQVSFGSGLAEILRRFEYINNRIVIHSDPTFVVGKPENWCMYNAGIEGVGTAVESCEASLWLGDMYEDIFGEQKPLFKSWVTRRREEPKDKLYERTFLHPLITPQAIAAVRELKKWQGREGLWFAGHFTTGMDLQDTALYSAIQVTKQLNPGSTRLATLNRRLVNKGIPEPNYDV